MLQTIVKNLCINYLPGLSGGTRLNEVRRVYLGRFVTQQFAHIKLTLVSQTISNEWLVDEVIQKLTYTVMDYTHPVLFCGGSRSPSAIPALLHSLKLPEADKKPP